MSKAPITIRDLRVDTAGDQTTLSGQVDGQTLYWRMPVRETIAPRGEPFVAGTLVAAMTAGRDLVLAADAPVDREFLENVEQLQGIFAEWFPHMRRVRIDAPAIAPRHGTAGRMTGYSGGFDSSYTVLRLASRLDGVVFFAGTEFREPNDVLTAQVAERLRGAVASRNIPLMVVDTNVKPIAVGLGGVWHDVVGGALASVPHALGLAEYWIAATGSWFNIGPYGTHPVTDPLWSSRATRIVQHGADARRIDKMRVVAAEAPDLFDVARVCYQGNSYNCGKCDKCLRTTTALRALGLASQSLPPLADATLLRGIYVDSDHDLADWIEIVDTAGPTMDAALSAELRGLITRYRRRERIRRLDQRLTGGRLLRALRGGKGAAAAR